MSSSTREIAESIIHNAFGAHPRYNCNPEMEDGFLSELFAISLSEEDLAVHPEARGYLKLFPLSFIEWKLRTRANDDDYISFLMMRQEYYSAIDELPEVDRLDIRRAALYAMHNALMRRDFGDLYDSFSSDCQGLTKEAEEFVASRRTAAG